LNKEAALKKARSFDSSLTLAGCAKFWDAKALHRPSPPGGSARRLRAQWAPMSDQPTDATLPTTTAPAGYLGLGVRIGVFDSGLGGLSVLRALRKRLPQAELLYVADSAHAPYGERDEDFIAQRSEALCQFLLGQGVHAIVVACNTATAAAIHTLRSSHPALPIVGVEPGVKPAVALSPGGRIGVLATPRTLASDKFQALLHRHGRSAQVFTQACPGLAAAIENGELNDPALHALVQRFTQPLKTAQVDTVVLGCTHYPFVAHLIQKELGSGVTIVDTAQAVADHTARLCARLIPAATSPGKLRLWTSGDPAHLNAVAGNWLNLEILANPLH
jgi:glutamate racemase